MQTQFLFGSIRIPSAHVFWEGAKTYAFVNLRPVTPGHVLIVPKRIVLRFAELDHEELHELTQVSSLISQVIGKGKSTIAIQDGPEAGQSVPHVHVHVVPWSEHAIAPDNCRKDRSFEEMAQEADEFRGMIARKERLVGV